MSEEKLHRNEVYWQRRAEQRLIAAEQKALRLEKTMREQFDHVYKNIEAQIAAFYFKYADDNGMSYNKAIEYLTKDERKEFQRTLEFYIEKASDKEYSIRFNNSLKTLSTRTRIKRLEELKISVEYEVNELYNKYNANSRNVFNKVYEESYYRTKFDIEQFTGFGLQLNRISGNVLESLLEYPWSGKNYSEKIWGHVDGLFSKLESILTSGIIQGKSNQDMAAELQKAADTVYKNAVRLVRTETNFIAGEATHKAYNDFGVAQYQFLATLDLKTSGICRSLDGQVFDEKDRKVGVNCHPMHPHCRSTDIPYIPDLEGTRVARGSDGKTYKVDRNMTYEEWYNKHVEGDANEKAAVEIIKKKAKNKAADKIQHKKYREILGNYIPESFEKFQEIKYNKNVEWEANKLIFKALNIDSNKVYERAKSGGVHKGTYEKAVIKYTITQSRKSIRSFQKQIDEHKDKIRHPERYDPNWLNKTEEQQKGLLKKWSKDLRRNKEEQSIFETVLKEGD